MVRFVVPTLVNKNRLDLGRYKTILPEEDGRSSPSDAEARSALQKMRHLDPSFHEAAIKGLEKGRETRAWSDSEILEAIRDFVRREGRTPEQHEFRGELGLPGYGTVWRRLGPVAEAVEQAVSD